MDNFSWFVGIFEGEGSITVDKSKGGAGPTLQIRMTDEDVIQKVAHICNANYDTYQPTKRGVTGELYKTQYRVRISGRKAIEMMELIQPYLSKRRKEQYQVIKENYHPKKTYKTEGYVPAVKKPYIFNF